MSNTEGKLNRIYSCKGMLSVHKYSFEKYLITWDKIFNGMR